MGVTPIAKPYLNVSPDSRVSWKMRFNVDIRFKAPLRNFTLFSELFYKRKQPRILFCKKQSRCLFACHPTYHHVQLLVSQVVGTATYYRSHAHGGFLGVWSESRHLW